LTFKSSFQHNNINCNKKNSMNKKSLLTCALVAVGVISQASADNTVYFTGSTAFRTQSFNTLNSTAGPSAGGVFDIPGTTVNGHVAPNITLSAWGGSHANGDNAAYMLFHGNIGGSPTFVDCAWSGSEAGIANITSLPAPAVVNAQTLQPLAGVNEKYLLTTVPNGINSTNPVASELDASARQGDVALADTSQASSDPLTQGAALVAYGPVCVVPFTWAKNNNTASAASAAKTAWSRLSNVSLPELVNEMSAAQTADVFTGFAADSSTIVYPVGRNNGSGTRANFENDTTYGLLTPVNQFGIGSAPDGGVTGGTAGGTLLLTAVGNNGYESGGNVASALGTIGSTSQTDPNLNGLGGHNAGWIAIGYLGISDATTLDATQSTLWLTENGVGESDQAIVGGNYSYWGYENLYGKPGNGGFQDTVANVFFSSLQFTVNSVYAGGASHSVGVPLADMNCTKPTDGSFPAHN
jgi:hypothetical protein